MGLENDDFLIGDILGEPASGSAVDLETEYIPPARMLRRMAKRRFERVQQQQKLQEVISSAPAPGESIHVVSDAKFDFWTWVPVMVGWLGRSPTLYCSTWTASRTNVVELFEVMDAGKIGVTHVLTGTYFKRRETAVYSLLLEGIRKRGGRYRAFQNHAKVLLIENPEARTWLVVEGSANLTSNPRTEQYVITNDQALHAFHRAWMEEAFSR